MDIQGYIIDHWMGKMSAEHHVLMVYEKDDVPCAERPVLQDWFAAHGIELKELMHELNNEQYTNSYFRRDKLYLYFMQNGKCLC